MTTTSEITTTVPVSPQPEGSEAGLNYAPVDEAHGYKVSQPGPRPGVLDVSVGSEGDAWWARTDALDITAEGDTLFGALVALREHVEEWLEYLEEVNPQLSEELEQQRSTAARLREPGSHWLGQIVFEFPA